MNNGPTQFDAARLRAQSSTELRKESVSGVWARLKHFVCGSGRDLSARKLPGAPRSTVRLARIGAVFLIAGAILAACEVGYVFNTFIPGKTASQFSNDPSSSLVGTTQGYMPGVGAGTYVEVWPTDQTDVDEIGRAFARAAYDPAGALSGTPPYLPLLLRQPDCSLTRIVIDSTLTVQEQDLDYQNFLHAALGGSTIPDRFTKGCIDPTTGIASQGAARVGTFANGNSALAIQSTDGVLVAVVSSTLAVLSQKDYPTISQGASGATVFGLASADLNGDGIPDIVVASATSVTTGTLSIFLGQGNGSFTAGATLNVPLVSATGVVPLGVTIDDVNGDGKLDLIATTAGSSSSSGITVFLGQGNGSFGAGITGPVNVGGQVAVTADFNGDGKKDIATSFGQILLGNGDGTFNLVSQTIPEGQQGGLAAADYNQDGKIDLAFTNGLAGTLDVYFGNGDGTFTYSASYVGLSGSVEASDLDGDGFPDLFVGTAHGGFYSVGIETNSFFQMVLNQGNGTFGQSRAYYQQGPNAPSTFANTPQPNVLYDVADFNGDGKPDVVMLLTNLATPVLSVLAGNGDGTLQGSGATGIQTSLSNPASAQYVVALVAGDVNADGKNDVVFAWTPNGTDQLNPNPHISVALGNGNGTFQAQQDYAIPTPVTQGLNDSEAPTLVLTDINGDGKPDIIYIDENGALYVMLNNGNGTFATPLQVGTEPNLTSLAVQDVNGDGKPDIVAITGGNVPPSTPFAAYLYLGNGNGTFQTPVTLAPGAYWLNAVAIADMNGDGKPDIIISGQPSDKSSSDMNVLLGNGDGTFQAAIVNSFPLEFSAAIAIGDINGDGKPDVVMAGTVGAVFFGNGDGTFDTTYSGSAYALQNVTAPKIAKLTSSGASNVLVADDAFGFGVQIFAGNTPHTPTTTTLAASTPILTPGQSVSLKVTISPQSGSGTPTGFVSVLDTTSNVSLGYGTLSAGSLTVATTALTASGAHVIEAVYSGDGNYGPSTSAASTVTVAGTPGAGFTLSASSPFSVINATGSAPTTTLTVTPTGGFTGNVSLSCSGLPTGASCNFAPASVALSSAAATSVLTLATASSSTSSARGPLLAAGLLLAGVLLPMALRRSRAAFMSNSLSVVLLCLGVLLGGCGGSSSPSASTSTSSSASSSGTSASSSSSGSSSSSSSSGSSTSSSSSGSSSSGSSSSGGSLTGVTAGAYTINITATSGTFSQTLSYGLTVN
jgi:hypothetical protein